MRVPLQRSSRNLSSPRVALRVKNSELKRSTAICDLSIAFFMRSSGLVPTRRSVSSRNTFMSQPASRTPFSTFANGLSAPLPAWLRKTLYVYALLLTRSELMMEAASVSSCSSSLLKWLAGSGVPWSLTVRCQRVPIICVLTMSNRSYRWAYHEYPCQGYLDTVTNFKKVAPGFHIYAVQARVVHHVWRLDSNALLQCRQVVSQHGLYIRPSTAAWDSSPVWWHRFCQQALCIVEGQILLADWNKILAFGSPPPPLQ